MKSTPPIRSDLGRGPERGWLISNDERVLVTGASGFLGVAVVRALLQFGMRKIRCLVRPGSDLQRLSRVLAESGRADAVEVIAGNLLSRDDCRRLAHEACVVYHLAAGTGTKSFSDAFLNSVVTTRNLIEACLENDCLRRFVSISSFAVYTNRKHEKSGVLDETSEVENDPGTRAEAYCYAKVRQDELVAEYGQRRKLPYVLLRPGVVYGPGKYSITGRVGIDSFGFFLHCGGANRIPFTYLDNCAEAVVLGGLTPGIEGEVFNIVDDDLPTSRQFLRLYKRHVKRFHSIYLPHALSFLFCYLWEKGASWSKGQLPAAFTRREWWATWKKTRYSNAKLKELLQWAPRVTTEEGLTLFLKACHEREARS